MNVDERGLIRNERKEGCGWICVFSNKHKETRPNGPVVFIVLNVCSCPHFLAFKICKKIKQKILGRGQTCLIVSHYSLIVGINVVGLCGQWLFLFWSNNKNIYITLAWISGILFFLCHLPVRVFRLIIIIITIFLLPV